MASFGKSLERALHTMRGALDRGVRASVIESAIITLVGRYLRVGGKLGRLAPAIEELERAAARDRDYGAALTALLGSEKLVCLDIGARGGPEHELADYEKWFRFFLVEGDPDEAEKLRASGHVVIDRLLHDGVGTAHFHITRVPSKSSILPPGGHILSYFGAGRLPQFDVVKTLELETTSVAELGRKHDVRFDVIKLDTQGTELHILRAFGEQRPLIMKCEISMAEIYRGQDLFYELGRHAYELGYVMFRLDMIRTPTPKASTFVDGVGRPSPGFPVHGDAFFMPDWTRDIGLRMLAERDRQWAALALMFGQEQLLHHVVHTAALPHAADIRRVLAELAH